MSDVKRYRMDYRGSQQWIVGVQNDHGDWVKHKDHIKAMDEKDARIEKLESKLNFYILGAKNSDRLIDLNDKTIKELQQENERLKQGWISVDDRAPKERQEVITCDVYNRMYHCTYRKNRFKLMFHCDDHSKVTHWQPLPQPPSEDV